MEVIASLNNGRFQGKRLRSTFGDFSDPDSIMRLMEESIRSIFHEIGDIAGISDEQRSGIVTVGFSYRDTATAVTEIMPDGSYLIRMSDGIFSLVGYLCDLNLVWSRSLSRSRLVSSVKMAREVLRFQSDHSFTPIVKAGGSALRYRLLNQRYFGISPQIGTRLGFRATINHGNLRILGTIFILAHEVGHAVLEHSLNTFNASGDAERMGLHEQEFEADLFAFDVLARMVEGRGEERGIALLGSVMGLLAVALSSAPLFVRPPETHPAVDSRIKRLFDHAAIRDSSGVTAMLWGVVNMAGQAAATESSMPESNWRSLEESKAFKTSAKQPGYIRMIEGLDRAISLSCLDVGRKIEGLCTDYPASVAEDIERIEIETLMDALNSLNKGAVSDALLTLGLQDSRLTDANYPLSYFTLTKLISATPTFNRIDELKDSTHEITDVISGLVAGVVGQALKGKVL
ncbi:hypothetical protein [Millisia brevis]|uniref:hypothetical protein n=1 Tax=Millisia brevis TaxID=264148 RepID=UPI0014725A7A|nr:hypothetical protein [Millisia brevis]